MSEGRPSLKLTFGKKKAPEEPPQRPAPPPPLDTPQRKLTLKIARKPMTDGEPEKPKKKKPSKKRPADEPAVSEPAPRAAPEQQTGPKRLKLNPSKKPAVQSIRIKNKGLVPNRPVGVGYDSEASDTEIDPSIEEQFILRMVPGEECDYLRRAIAERRFDRGEFSFKPLTREGRRAVLRIKDKQFAATLVDLPCIIEGMKSWDRRGWYKAGDICQMLLVLGPIEHEKQALDFPIPPDIERSDDKTLQYPHGITPPLQWVRKRRFRERVSTRTIEQVEKAVEDLIAQDEAAIGIPRYELVDSASLNRAEGLVHYDEYDDEQDAEGEWDEGMEEAPGVFEEDFEDSLAAEMEAALAAEPVGANAPSAAGATASMESGVYQAGTPMATKPSTPAAESSGDESEESDGEDRGVPEDDLDEEQLEQQRQMQQQREEIAELEELIRAETTKWEKMQNRILKNKLAQRIQELKKDLSLKKVSIGEGDDDA